MTVTMRALADRRRSLAWWALGVALLVLFTVSLYPSLKEQASVDELIEGMPEALRSMIGYQEGVPLTSPAGFLNARLFASVAPVILLVFGIGAGARAIGGAEEDGTLEPLLANPVSRLRVAVERYLAVLVLLAAVTAVFTLSLLALGQAFGALEGVSMSGLAAACAAVFALALLHATLAYTIGAATGRRGAAVGVAAAVAVAGYLVQNLLSVTGSGVRVLSPWHWYMDRNMLADGPSPLPLWLPLLVTAVLLAVGLVAFRRRDLR